MARARTLRRVKLATVGAPASDEGKLALVQCSQSFLRQRELLPPHIDLPLRFDNRRTRFRRMILMG
jgi:hypothetical protein